jgi:phosphate acetyltransferase
VRPIVASSEELDPRIELLRRRYSIDADPGELWAYGSDEVAHLMAAGRSEEVFQGIVELARKVEDRFDFVLYDGTDYTGAAAALEFDVNTRVAADLGAPVVALVSGAGRRPQAVVERVRIARESLLTGGCTIAAYIVNRVEEDDLDEVDAHLAAEDLEAPHWILPELPLLTMPTVAEIIDALDADQLAGVGGDLDREVTTVKIAAMSLQNVLDHLVEGALLITPGDRPDVIVSALVSRLSTTYPNIAALVLTGGFPMDPRVERLLDGLSDVQVPLLAVATDTYTTARAVAAVPAVLRSSSVRKVSAALELFDEHVDTEALEARIEVARTDRVTPLMFEYDLLHRARKHRKHIVLPEGTDDRILRATEILRRRNVVDLTLLGDAEEVRNRAEVLGVDLREVPVIDPAESSLRESFAEEYEELRRHKGVTLEFALQSMLDVSYFGTMMVHRGLADGMVSGAAHTTQHTIRPAFEIIRTAPGVSIVSSVFLMAMADRVLVYGDCAVNPEPDAEGLADIAISSATTAAAFGIEPRVAMLSYSTGASGTGRAVDRVRQATELVRERRPDLHVEGPIQYDAAVDVTVGEAKLPGSEVAGRATVFIFPDLNTGNNTYKAVQRSAGVVAIGPVLQGLNKPVNDLSRGCLVDDIVNTVTITAVQAQLTG